LFHEPLRFFGSRELPHSKAISAAAPRAQPRRLSCMLEARAAVRARRRRSARSQGRPPRTLSCPVSTGKGGGGVPCLPRRALTRAPRALRPARGARPPRAAPPQPARQAGCGLFIGGARARGPRFRGAAGVRGSHWGPACASNVSRSAAARPATRSASARRRPAASSCSVRLVTCRRPAPDRQPRRDVTVSRPAAFTESEQRAGLVVAAAASGPPREGIGPASGRNRGAPASRAPRRAPRGAPRPPPRPPSRRAWRAPPPPGGPGPEKQKAHRKATRALQKLTWASLAAREEAARRTEF